LAGILLKTGVYGILRIILNFFPDFSKEIKNIIIILSLFNIIYSPLIATLQKDLKRLIAYSSIGHMGFITIGIFTFEKEGIMGSIFQIFNHGITISALFMIAGAIYKRKKTREIEKLGGVAFKIPILCFFYAGKPLAAVPKF
jgi:NADH-quinone oxidoreductase subunit M